MAPPLSALGVLIVVRALVRASATATTAAERARAVAALGALALTASGSAPITGNSTLTPDEFAQVTEFLDVALHEPMEGVST